VPFSLPFRRDQRREELERARQRITQLRLEIERLASAPPATSLEGDGTDPYRSVQRLRESMVHDELISRREELEDLVAREAELRRVLRLPPESPVPAGPRPVGAAQEPERLSAAAAPTAAEPATAVRAAPRVPPAVQAPAPHTPKAGVVRVARPSQPARAAEPEKPPRAPIRVGFILGHLVRVVLALIAIAVVAGLALVLSGIMEIDPSRYPGPLADLARLIPAKLVQLVRETLRVGPISR